MTILPEVEVHLRYIGVYDHIEVGPWYFTRLQQDVTVRAGDIVRGKDPSLHTFDAEVMYVSPTDSHQIAVRRISA